MKMTRFVFFICVALAFTQITAIRLRTLHGEQSQQKFQDPSWPFSSSKPSKDEIDAYWRKYQKEGIKNFGSVNPLIASAKEYMSLMGDVPIVTDEYITMRDGVQLYGKLWLMESWKNRTIPEKRATVLIVSPYIRAEQDVALPWLAAGYAVLQEDMRGKHKSDGEFSFWETGGPDGYDTMQWISQQEFSNGVVFSYGFSADGINALTEIFMEPQWLRSQFIIWASGDGHATAYQGGAFREELIEGWLTLIQEPRYIQTVKANEAYGPFWYNITINDKYDRIDFQTIHSAGWYDIFQQPQIECFDGTQSQSAEAYRGTCQSIDLNLIFPGKSYIVVTPHGHCQFEIDLEPFPGSYTELPVNIAEQLFRDADVTQTESKKEDVAYSPVNFYVMAPRSQNPNNVGNYYTALQDWPTPAFTTFYMQPNGGLSTDAPVASSASFSYVYDPYNPVPTWGGNNLFISCGPLNQLTTDDRDDVIVFTSDPLQQDTAITGHVTANLFVSSDREDTDFTVKLMDLYPDDKESVLLLDGILRMKWRENDTVAVPMQAGIIYEVQVDLWSTSYVFPQGHRISVAVSSSNYPRFQANINRFMPISEWTGTLAYRAHNSVYFDKSHPSSISLPIVELSQIPKAAF